jgi:flagellar capping protein FliD
MQASINDIESRIVRMESKISVKEKTLLAQFSRLEILLSKYDVTSQFLSNTIAAWQKSN